MTATASGRPTPTPGSTTTSTRSRPTAVDVERRRPPATRTDVTDEGAPACASAPSSRGQRLGLGVRRCGSTARAPSDPTLAGGLRRGSRRRSEPVTASGSTDAGSGLDRYELRTSTDGGSTWSAPAAGSSLAVSAEGETSSGSARSTRGPRLGLGAAPPSASTARRRPPPASAAARPRWQNVASDRPPGVRLDRRRRLGPGSGYEYAASTDGGATWSSPTTGASVAGVRRGRHACPVPRR